MQQDRRTLDDGALPPRFASSSFAEVRRLECRSACHPRCVPPPVLSLHWSFVACVWVGCSGCRARGRRDDVGGPGGGRRGSGVARTDADCHRTNGRAGERRGGDPHPARRFDRCRAENPMSDEQSTGLVVVRSLTDSRLRVIFQITGSRASPSDSDLWPSICSLLQLRSGFCRSAAEPSA